MKVYAVIFLFIILSSCKLIKKERPLFPVGPNYIQKWKVLSYSKGDRWIKYSNIKNYVSLTKDTNGIDICLDGVPNVFGCLKKNDISDNIEFKSTKIEDERLNPQKYKNYVLNYYDTTVLYSFKVTNVKSGESVMLNSSSEIMNLFPNELENNFSETLYMYKFPVMDSCNYLSSYGKINYKLRPLSVNILLVFNPFSAYYRRSIFDIWKDYQVFIHCQLITVDTTNFSGTQKENLMMPFELRQFDEKLNEIFIEQYKEILKSNFQTDSAKMFKSYFELIFYQIYRPSDFKIKDNIGKRRSFLFTSNNTDYPGNYEVKFNIYEPYRFKVFKR